MACEGKMKTLQLASCVLLLVSCILLAACQQNAPIVVVSLDTPAPTPTLTPAPLRVYVSGAVNRPGVYTLPPHSLVDDAIKAAGGATADADLVRVNLALEVKDQQHVLVPRVGETPSPVPTGEGGGGGRKININKADAAELDTLPGIGPATAQRIIDYRTKNGPFKKIDDLKNVSGIGPATFDKLKDLVTVE
jgi:competence protein ComEA